MTEMPTIDISEGLRQRLGSFANRDESWDDALERVMVHVDEEAAKNDRDNRTTVHSAEHGSVLSETSSGLSQLANGTVLRHQYKRGSHAGGQIEAQIKDGQVEYDGEVMSSPSRAAVVADHDRRGSSAPDDNNGWTFWEYRDEERGEWRSIDELRG